MNRVVLCGRLSCRPVLTRTPCGVPVTAFHLLVPRDGMPPAGEPGTDEVPCLALRHVAEALCRWGEPGLRLNLEGRLRAPEAESEAAKSPGPRVLVEYAYRADAAPASAIRERAAPGAARAAVPATGGDVRKAA